MGRIGKEVSGQLHSLISFVGVAVTTGIPMWRVTKCIGGNIVTGQIVWDGLWMNCVMQSTGQMQCKINDSVMRLTIGALLVLIPVCWTAAFTISDFNNPLTIETERREIGASIYIGWGSTALLLIGWIILCTSCPPQKMYGYPGYPQGTPMYPIKTNQWSRQGPM